MAIDSRNLFNEVLGIKTVTNAFLLDPKGILRWQHLHGFRIQRPEMAERLEKVLSRPLEEIEPSTDMVQESVDIEVLRAELASQPDNADFLFMLAEALSQEGRTEEAMDTYRRVIELRPTESAPYYALGSLLVSDNRTDEAVDVWKQALDKDPMNFTIRKQIWRVQHPERFYPTIDMDFQVDQVMREGFPDYSKLPVSIRTELERRLEEEAEY
jgi:tetratricopeptide (TPR) repeat protein